MKTSFVLSVKKARILLSAVALMLFSANQLSAQYCTPFIAFGCSSNDYIKSFSTTGGITNITNPGTNCGTASTGISLYLGMTHTTVPGGLINFSVDNTPSFSEGYMMWVDYNIDGDFDDAGENVWNGGMLASGASASGSFTVPANATPGSTRLRVMCSFVTTNFGPCDPQNFGEVEDYTFVINAPCTGTPDAFTVGAPSLQCPSKPFTVELLGVPQTDLTYVWSYSDDGVQWQPVAATVGSFGNFTDVITKDRWYRCFITCNNSGLSFTTPEKLVQVAPFYYCYCDNAASAPLGLDIGNVTVNSLPEDALKFSNGLATPPIGNNTAKNTYSNFQFSAPTIVMYRDSSFKVSVQQITSNNTMPAAGNAVVFIDFDRNGKFDANEKVLTKTITGGAQTQYTESEVFTVPRTAAIGLTGMRVILSTGKTDSCGSGFAEGEVEDYLVDMRYEPCTNADNPGMVEASAYALCPDYGYSLTNSIYENRKSELTRIWQVSGDNVYWQRADNKTNADSIMRIFRGQSLYYRVRMTCPANGGDTSYTKEVNIQPKDGYKCYCYSEAIGGKYDTSDLGGFALGDYATNTGGPHLSNPVAHNKRTDHTDEPMIIMYADSVYSLAAFQTQSNAVHADAKVTLFIDFNNNKMYDVPYERVFTNYTSISNFTVDDKFTVPSAVIAGVPTGMRVIINNDIAANDPSDLGCGAYISGETHDYVVQFGRIFPTGIAGTNMLINNFGLYPNPTNGKFTVQFNSLQELKNLALTITSMTGQQVYHQSYSHNGGQFSQQVDVSNIAKGVYYVELRADGQRVTEKLIIK